MGMGSWNERSWEEYKKLEVSSIYNTQLSRTDELTGETGTRGERKTY
jgi:hypothetical protein